MKPTIIRTIKVAPGQEHGLSEIMEARAIMRNPSYATELALRTGRSVEAIRNGAEHRLTGRKPERRVSMARSTVPAPFDPSAEHLARIKRLES